jgi:ribose transport system ATP-binding protein
LPDAAAEVAAALRIDHISKTFPGTRALDDVSLAIAPGEVHGLVGGNGSGKSTLIKILAGVYHADAGAGTVAVAGSEPVGVEALSPDWARSVGLHFVHQDPAVFPLLTVADNIALGHGYPTRPPCQIRHRRLRRRTQEILDRYAIGLRPGDMIEDLSAAQRSMVAIARALQDQDEQSGGLLVLDEPTASLPGPEVDVLLDGLRVFAASGQSILFVSHRTPEVLGLADRVSVLRDGRLVDTVDGAGLTEEHIVELIVGRKIEALERDLTPSTGSRKAILHARNLYGRGLNGVTMELREGEVLGIAGLVGSGRSELLKSLFGAQRIDSGTILIDALPVSFSGVGEAMDAGLAYVPEDRTIEASFPEMTVRENLSAADIMRYFTGARMNRRAERDDANALIEEYAVRTTSDAQVFATLSGGNQQKVILARWLRRKPRILLLDEPTHGVDIGARTQIYKLIAAAAAGGTSVILVSSDNDELAILSDRVLIMVQGRVTREIEGPGIDADRIGELALEPAEPPTEQR